MKKKQIKILKKVFTLPGFLSKKRFLKMAKREPLYFSVKLRKIVVPSMPYNNIDSHYNH